MPIYEFNCQACQTEFEVLLRGDEVAACPDCGSKTLEKQFSVVAQGSPNASDLPISQGTCGRPQCGTGGCQGMM